jgi:O-phospho-L-seryl-tRNASec:L-selenocysteinyl-tRNA synthase
MTFIKNLIILPFATGMSITLSLLTLKNEKPNAKYVIWPRIDQKTCFKSMLTANLIPIIIEPILNKDDLATNLDEIEKQINLISPENILCVFSTTSCFAPRGYDSIKNLSTICKKYNLFHVVNNAYGIYCTKINDILNQSNKIGRVDVLISSTDKNFMVPVGGSIVYSSNSEIIDKIKKNYPGRASMSPILDLFISFLEMGKDKYKFLIADRKEKYIYLKDIMSKIAMKYSERILENSYNNKISLAMTLSNICKNAGSKNDITYLGSLFYSRQISGIKIIAPSGINDISGYKFNNYGSHIENYPHLPYCAFACAIGITKDEIDSFAVKFEDIVNVYLNSNKIHSQEISSENFSKNTTSITSTDNKIKGKKKSSPQKFEISSVESFQI